MERHGLRGTGVAVPTGHLLGSGTLRLDSSHALPYPRRAVFCRGHGRRAGGATAPCDRGGWIHEHTAGAVFPFAHVSQCPPGTVPTRGTDEALDSGIHHFLETVAQAPPVLGLHVHTASGVALCLLMAFGDSVGIETRLYNVTEAATVTAYHQEGTEAIHSLRALIDDGVRGGPVELGPYFVEVGREAVSVFMNSSSVHAGEALAFAGSHENGKGLVVMHRFPSVSSYNVSFASRTQAGPGPAWRSPAWRSVVVCYRMQPLSIYTNGTVFATDTDIAFEAVTTETIPLEFMWHFGDDPPVRTTSRSVRRRLRVPRGYQVTVKASSMVSSVVSKPHLIRVQQRIVANRLLSAASALVNTSVAFECRISFGTDVAYRWDFGDGTVSLGSHRSSHIYSREGEFTVRVLAFNAVSTATLQKRLFVVREPCQPPPVKNMGPGKVQIWRSQPLRLGVTFEAAVLCDISQGLAYTWSFLDAKGSRVPLPAAVNTHRQTVVLPGYTLASGNYTATAKVQIRGSVVHSDYCVGVEVRPRAPVSVIAEGTHLFVPRTALAPIVLRGSQSYDPDHPGATLRYYWTCSAASSPGRPCFEDSLPSLMDTGSPTVAFSARWLSTCCDQFLMTLTVSSGGRNSSEAQVFLSTRQDPTFRFVRISWASFRGASVNRNAELSLRAACEDCGDVPGLSFSWELFLVNATEDGTVAVPSCRAVGLLGVSGLGAVWKSSEPIPLSTEPSTPDPEGAPMLFPREPSPETLGQPAVSAPGSTSPESTAGPRRVPAAGDTVVPGEDPEEGLLGPELASWDEEAPTGSLSESSWSPPHPDFEAYYSDIQEAEPSPGRQPGGNTSPPESGASEDDEGSPSEGDNLVGPFLSASRAQPALLIDWPKTPVSRAVFQSYTSSGITGPVVTIKPFSLSSGRTYVLQASVVSTHGLLGKAQLYLTVNRAPQDVACQVQPHRGLEAHTLFSVFCMSGEPDLEYEFSYQIGNAPRRTLYHGRDAQYYFVLPAGEPSDGYKVMVSTEITDGLGSKAQPCAVAVMVLPRYRGMDCPTEDLYNSSRRNLSTLQLMGSYTEIRNYVTVLTGILSRLTTEDGSASCGQWSLTRDALISSVCSFAFADEEEVMGVVPMLKDLVSFPPKVSSASTLLLLRFARALLAQGRLPGGLVLGLGLRLELIQLLSRVWEGSGQEEALARTPVWEDGLEVVSALLLGCLSLHHERELRVSAGQVEFLALLHDSPQQSVQSLGPVQVHLPGDLAGHSRAGEETQSPCHISQLVLFRKNPHPWGGRAAGQVGGAVGLTLHTCSGTRPIRRHRLASPVTVEFGEDDGPDSRRSKTAFALLRDGVNLHPFAGLSDDAQESLQIHIEFSTPASRAFPVLLLLRFSERPTPSSFLVKQTFLWEGQTVQIYMPAAAWKASRVGYLSLLDADYNRRAPNKYLAELVNYTVRFQWLRCLLWDKGEWKSGSFSPQPGTSPEKVSCSYDRLALFSVLRRKLNTSLEVSHVSELRSRPRNLIPSACVVAFTVLYRLLAAKSRGVDHREKEKTGSIFLQEEVPPGHQLYAVVVDTGFRAPARFSSKVYMVLCGENGLSETRELHCPRRPLFERNSRHTFVLSAPAQLGALRTIRLWHDSRGPSPSWFVSHVMVKELRSGRAWFFPAQCWLAASRRGGRVHRELACLRRGPGFWKLFHAKSTEYLEDFHVWLSVYSRPSGSSFLHTPRLAVSFCLLCVYACLAALVTTRAHSQLFLGAGPTDLTLHTSGLGLLCSLLGSPAAQLLSLLLRLSEEATRPPQAGPGSPPRGVQARAPQGPDSCKKTLEALEPDQRPASAALSGRHQAWRKAASSQGTACPHQESGTCGASRSEPVLAPSHGPGDLLLPRPRALLLWSGRAAWAICGATSLACALGTAFLGYRFEPAQCVWWLHLLLLSVACCVFITQPLMICVVALGFAWKRRDDSHFFVESLNEATRDLDPGLEGRPRTHGCPCGPGCAGAMAEVLAARQQARRLRWARPPALAQLKVTGEKMKRERRTRAALRDVSVHGLRLLLLLCLTYGRFSQEECSLSQAIRKQFTSAAHSWDGPRSPDGWWDWSLTVLLDGLHPAGPSPGAQPGPLGGRCHLLGSPVIKQLKVAPQGSCKPPGPSSATMEDSPRSQSPEAEGPENRNRSPSCPGGCGVSADCVHSLGRTRREVQAALTGLRASRWIDHGTRAVSVHFTLFHPPSRLFTSVALGVEILPTGALVPSSQVDSVSVFRSDSALDHGLVLSELASLVLGLAHLCFQVYAMVDEDGLSYWHKPGNWLELAVAGTGLAYHVAAGHLATLAGDVADQFHRGFYQVFVDLSPMASWNQRVRWLQGLLSFLLLGRCVELLGPLALSAACSPVLCRSLSRAFVPALAGALLLAAHCHLHRLLLATWAPAAFPGLPLGFPRRSHTDSGFSLPQADPRATVCCRVALCAVLATLCFRMLRHALRTSSRKRRSFPSKPLVRLDDVRAYAQRKVLAILGLGTPRSEETEVAEDHNRYLDELASLLDELLTKVDGLSDSRPLPLLEKQPRSSAAPRAEGSALPGAPSRQAIGMRERPHHKRVSRRQPSPAQFSNPH